MLPFQGAMNRNANKLLTVEGFACRLRYRKNFLKSAAVYRHWSRCHNNCCSTEDPLKIVGQALKGLPEGLMNELKFIDGVQKEVGDLRR